MIFLINIDYLLLLLNPFGITEGEQKEIVDESSKADIQSIKGEVLPRSDDSRKANLASGDQLSSSCCKPVIF